MTRRDVWLLAAIVGSLAAGVAWPGPAARLAPAMPYILMAFLLLAFLRVEVRGVGQTLAGYPGKIGLLVVCKLVLWPFLVHPAVAWLTPEYGLGAVLLAGVSTGLSAPFFTGLVGGDMGLVLVMTVSTTLLLPLTLPLMTKLLAGQALTMNLMEMVGLLTALIFAPLVAALTLRRWLPRVSATLDRRAFPLSLLLLAGLNLGAAGLYAPLVLANTGQLVTAAILSTILGGMGAVMGGMVFLTAPPRQRAAAAGSLGWINNALVIVLGGYLGDPLAALLATLYLIPFYGLIWPLGRLAGRP